MIAPPPAGDNEMSQPMVRGIVYLNVILLT